MVESPADTLEQLRRQLRELRRVLWVLKYIVIPTLTATVGSLLAWLLILGA